jgi:hypothetical protein
MASSTFSHVEVALTLKILVVDVDGTLVLAPMISRIFRLAASVCVDIARRIEHVNAKIVSKMDGYDKVIILTGRNITDFRSTERQLRSMKVPFDSIMCCPLDELVVRWKTSVVQRLSDDSVCYIDWIDNIFEKGIPEYVSSAKRPNIMPLAPNDVHI